MWKGEQKPTERPAFGNAAGAYARHRLGFPPSMYDRLASLGLLVAGQRLLDLGTGTGTLARAAATHGLRVTGTDIDTAMLAEAERLAREDGLDIRFLEARAEATGRKAASYDLVTAGQCWHWFDRRDAAAECLRVLKPGGHLLVCHYDWIPVAGSAVEATEQLILSYNPDWKAAHGTGIYPAWFSDMADAGFSAIQSFSYDEPAVYSHEAWVGRIEASAGVAILDADTRAAFKADLADMLKRGFPEDPIATPHRVFCVWGRKP